VDPHVLYLGSNVLLKTTNGGDSWSAISPDLTRKEYEVPPNLGAFATLDPNVKSHRGVIYTIAPSPKDGKLIWVGTEDGLIQVTRDGGATWKNVTPPDFNAWSKVSLIEASHFDANTAYAAVNRFRVDDLRPHIYRTRDAGAHWTEIVEGLPDRAVVNAVREDPVRKSLLYAGTEIGVFVSFDDGEHWKSLQLNLPVTSVRDLVIHENDLVVGTHGRSFWILDDVTPLRQMSEHVTSADAFLFAPAPALRWRWNRNTDTPVPPEEPAGQNPPDGAILDYSLKQANGAVTLEIYDAHNRLVRGYSSEDKPDVTQEELEKELNVPTYWVRMPKVLSAAGGMHRFVWDLRYAPPKALQHDYPIAAIIHDTPRMPRGALVLPGRYTVKLTANGKTYTQSLIVTMDPRVKTSPAGLEQQLSASLRLAKFMEEDYDALMQAREIQKQVLALEQKEMPHAVVQKLREFGQQVTTIEGGGRGGRRRGATGPPSLSSLNGQLAQVFEVIQGSDNAPTTQALAAVTKLEARVQQQLAAWKSLQTGQMASLNQHLAAADLPAIALKK
jgi:hypothetical protein